jgi:hypothetical protein
VIAGNVNRMQELFNENPNLDLNNITENESTLLHIAVSSIRQGKSNPGVLKVLNQWPAHSVLFSLSFCFSFVGALGESHASRQEEGRLDCAAVAVRTS